jgi:hypothetical protein
LTQALAQIKQELEQKLKLKVGNDPINVHLFNSRRSYQAYMRQHVPRAINRQALFVKGPQGSSVYAYKNKDFDTDIRHECTHALIHNSVQFIPLWMDEGLAEYFAACHLGKGLYSPGSTKHCSKCSSLGAIEPHANHADQAGSDG